MSINKFKIKTGLIVGTAAIFAIFYLVLKYNGSVTQTLWDLSQGGRWLLPLVLTSAVIDSINPCAFSVLLLTIAFLFSIGRLRTNILRVGSSYILGLFIVYVLIGLGILQALHLFNTPNFMAKVGATLLITLGVINLISHYMPSFPIKLKIPTASHKTIALLMEKASLPAAFLLGGIVGLCEFPCTGGPYLMVLGLLHDKVTYYRGLGYLLVYNLVFIAPLVIILLLASNKMLLDKLSQWKREKTGMLKLVSAIAMIAIGVLIFLI